MKHSLSAPWRRPLSSLMPAALATLLLLAGCGGGGGGSGESGDDSAIAASLSVDAMNPANWEIGPIIGGTNYSIGMPLHPSPHPEGWVIELPYPTNVEGSVHYVTMPTGSLAGKTKVTMRYRIEADPGVKILPTNFPGSPSMLTLYFQRANDTWSAKGPMEAYRWYASFSRHSPLTPKGDALVEARFDQDWTAILTSSRQNNPSGYAEALSGAARVGFVLGGGDGAGHGVYATGPARIVVTSFQVE